MDEGLKVNPATCIEGESGMKSFDVIIIGAGQAGLAAGYFLKKKGLSFVILDH